MNEAFFVLDGLFAQAEAATEREFENIPSENQTPITHTVHSKYSVE